MKVSRLAATSCALVATLSFARNADPSPEEAQWATAVQTFAAVLEGTVDREALAPLLSDHSWVAPFARNRTEAVPVLVERLSDLRVVSARGCLAPAVTSATDFIEDIRADGSIAETIRQKLVPPEGQDLRSADATMARWFTTALETQPGDPVALIAMYDEGHLPEGPTSPGAPPSMTLLLVRGEFDLKTGTPRISRVLYGTLEAAVR